MSRDYCFTQFDMDWKPINFFNEKIKYLIAGQEICPETKRPHFQCYVAFPRTYAIPGAQKLLGIGKSHMEPKRGTRLEASNYCKKENNWQEWGVLDVLTTKEVLNLPVEKIKQDYPLMYCRYHRGIEKLQAKGPKWRDIEVTWLWGAPGVGKTRKVMEMDDVYKIDDPYEWWDGYEGETILLIDDFDRGTITRKKLIHILDGYHLRLPTKGGVLLRKLDKNIFYVQP